MGYTVHLGEFWKWPKTRHKDLKKNHTIPGFCGMDRPEVNDDLSTAAVNIEFKDMTTLTELMTTLTEVNDYPD